MIKRIDDSASVLKVLLTLMVIFVHSFSLVPACEGTVLYDIKVYLSFIIPRVAVPMFFIYSGYFFFKGKDFNLEIWRGKMKTRLRTLVVPFLLWSVIGAAFFLLLEKSYRGIGFLEILNRTFWMNAYTPSSSLPQWVGYEIPKVTTLMLPLWYVRDLILLMIVSPLLGGILRCKVLSVATLLGLLAVYLFTDTDKMPYIGMDNLLFFFAGACLSYAARDVFYMCKGLKTVSFLLAIAASIWAFVAYGHQAEVIGRHWYIVTVTVFFLSVSMSDKVRSAFANSNMGGVKCSLYIART